MHINKILDIIYVSIAGLYKSGYTIISGAWKYPIKKAEKAEVLVIGNGPSLHDTNIDALRSKNLDIACVNFFPAKEPMFWSIKPEYLCLIDPVFFENTKLRENERSQLFETLERVDWDMKIICLYKNTIPVKNDYITYEWMSSKSLYKKSLERYRHFLYRKNLVNCGTQNVIIAALYYFITKKTNTIYLAGVDMSEFKTLFVDEDNNIMIESTHSYGIKKENWLSYGILEKGEFYKLLGFYVKMFEQFYCLSKYAKSQKVKIFNLSKYSYIDVFEKIRQFDN